MPAFLAPLLSFFTGGIPWKLIGAVALAGVLAVLWWRNGVLSDQRDKAVAQITIAEAKAQQNADAVKQLKADQTKALAAVDHVNEVATIRQKEIVTIKEAISHESVSSSCGAAVHTALRGLRERAAASP